MKCFKCPAYNYEKLNKFQKWVGKAGSLLHNQFLTKRVNLELLLDLTFEVRNINIMEKNLTKDINT